MADEVKKKTSAPLKAEIGRVGAKRFSGVFYEEFVPELRGIRGIEVYKEMSENDDVIGAILFAIEMLMRQCDFNVEPGGKTAKDKEAAEFVKQCMHDMQFTWTDTISEIISFLTYGWSYHEIVYKYRRGRNKNQGLSSKYNDGLIGWKKLPIRAQETFFEWRYDEESDELLGMVQTPPPYYPTLFIPIEKALHFTTKSRKGNPEGKSILRNVYRDWYFKKRIQEIEGIGIERDLAGFPVITGPEGQDLWEDDEDMKKMLMAAESIVTSIRRDSREGLVLPFGWTLQLLSTGSRRQFDTNQIIERYDKRIATAVLADFVLLGQQSVGSFALADNKTQLFSLAIGTYLDIICEVFNNQAIPRLIDINGDHFKGITEYPKMTHGDIEAPDIEKLSNFVANMVGNGIIAPDEELENHMRRAAGLPEIPEGSHREYGMPGEENGADGQTEGQEGGYDSQEAQSIYKIVSILEKYQKGTISRNIATSMMEKIGCDPKEINTYLADADQNIERMKQEAAAEEKKKMEEKDAKDAERAAKAKKSLGR